MAEMTGLLVSSQTSQKGAAQNKLQLNKGLIFVTILSIYFWSVSLCIANKKFSTMNPESSNVLPLVRALILQHGMTTYAMRLRPRRLLCMAQCGSRETGNRAI